MKLNISKEKPKIKAAWWAMGLGLVALFEIPLFGIYAIIGRQLGGGVQSGPGIGLFGILITIAAVTTSVIIYRRGERSWVLWAGFIPAVIIGGFWLFMLIAEIISAIFGLGF